jgi:hypothetical protein
LSPAASAVRLLPSNTPLPAGTIFDRTVAADPELEALEEVRATRRWMAVTGKAERQEKSAGTRGLGDGTIVRAG